MLVCRPFHQVATPITYEHIRLDKKNGRSLLRRFIRFEEKKSSRSLEVWYSPLIKRITYTSSTHDFDLCAIPLLATVLSFLPNVAALAIEIAPASSRLLFNIFRRRGIIREGNPAANAISNILGFGPVIDEDAKPLPSLISLKISAPIESLHLARGRSLDKLTYLRPLDLQQFGSMFGTFVHEPISRSLVALDVNVLSSVDLSKLTQVLHQIFSILRHLSIAFKDLEAVKETDEDRAQAFSVSVYITHYHSTATNLPFVL